VYSFTVEELAKKLKDSYGEYYTVKKNHTKLRQMHLEELAQVMADHNNTTQLNMLKQLKTCEMQWSVAKKIKHLQGKLTKGGTTMVTVETPEGGLQDLTGQNLVEEAIMSNIASKFQQSHHRPFYHQPLRQDLGFKGITTLSSAVLGGLYEAKGVPEEESELLKALATPQAI